MVGKRAKQKKKGSVSRIRSAKMGPRIYLTSASKSTWWQRGRGIDVQDEIGRQSPSEN